MATRAEYMSELGNHVLDNKLALFVGAGFSSVFGYPSWSKLLLGIIEEYDIRDMLVQTSLFPFINDDDSKEIDKEKVNELILDKLLGVDYLRLAGYIDSILEEHHGVKIHKVIADKIRECRDKRLGDDNVKKLKEFLQFNNQYLEDIITTNYDDNLEYCIGDASVIHRDISSLNTVKHRNKVYKIHGCVSDDGVDNPDIVITEKDYNNFIAKNKYLFYKVYSFFTEKKIVFIGYSINDPNVRSILNDVIEENEKKVDLEMYWVTRGKMKPLDKQYYEKHFKLKIIEDYEITDFFDDLQVNINTQDDLRKLEGAELVEFVKAYRKNYQTKGFILDIINKDIADSVLKSLYDEMMTDDVYFTINTEPYLALISSLDAKSLAKHKLAVQELFEIGNKRQLYKSVGYAFKNAEFIEMLRKSNLVDGFVEELLKVANSDHDFGDYADTIEMLLKVSSVFEKEIQEQEKRFLNALTYCIRFSCYSSHKRRGFDYYGLDKLRDFAHLLSFDLFSKLIDEMMSRMDKGVLSDDELERIECLIDNSSFADKDNILEARYKFAYKDVLIDGLFYSFRHAVSKLADEKVEDYSFKIGDNTVQIVHYVAEDSIHLINKDTEEDYYSIEYGFDDKRMFVRFNDEYTITNRYELMEIERKGAEIIENDIVTVVDYIRG